MWRVPFCDTHCTHSRIMENRYFITLAITDKAAAQVQYVRDTYTLNKTISTEKHDFPKVPEFSLLPDCRACRKRGVPGFMPV